MAFRILDQDPQYRDDLGVICAAGTLTFTATGTTTAKNVYGEPALTTNLGNVITLDADGRTNVDVWLSGQYRVVLKDADGVTVWTKDNVRDIDTTVTQSVPAPTTGTDGQALLTDGAAYYFGDIEAVPSPTGHSGKQLGTDGAAIFWEAKPVATVYTSTSLPGGITSSTTRLVVGLIAFVWGTDSAPSSGTLKTTKAVTFATAFSGAPYHVGVSPTSNSSTGESGACSSQALTASATGFTAAFFAGAEDNGGVAEINTTVPFTYLAVGPA